MPFEIDAEQLKSLAESDPAAAIAYVSKAHEDALAIEVNGLKKKNGELLGKLTEADGLKGYKALGKTPEEILAELEEARRIREEHEAKGRGVANDEVEKLVEERLGRKITTIKTDWETKLGEKEKRIRELEESDARNRAIAESERLETRLVRIAGDSVLPEAWEDFKSHARNFIKWDENGKPVVIDPESGVEMAGKAGNMTLEELAEDIRKKRGYLFRREGSGSPLGGANTRRTNGSIGSYRRSTMTVAQKTAFIREHGEEEYLALPE